MADLVTTALAPRAAAPGAKRTTSQPSPHAPASGLAARVLIALLAFATVLALAPAQASAQGENGHVLIYSGTTGYRHGGTQAINQGAIDAIQAGLTAAGYTSDSVTCNTTGTGAGGGPADLANPPGCRNPDVGNPATFTEANLANYDAIYLHSASDYWSGTGGTPGQLWNASEEQAIIDFVQSGGGIAASHNMTDAGAGVETWDWWDGGPDSVVGTTMAGHAATDLNNEATVQVADRNHLSTRDLPDTYEFGDEHYNWDRNVRGDHHVLATLDERTYEPGGNGMGQDHPISWCKTYDGDSVEDGTGNPKPYDDGRTWLTGMGHFAANYTENGGANELVEHTVGGIRWAAGEGKKSDCGGTVWSNFTRTVLVSDANNPIAIDVAADGKVYWTEIGPTISNTSEGFVKMHDPEGAPNNQTTVATIPTRADHGNSEDGVLGMSLEPGFDLSDPAKRNIFVYYSPRFPDFTESNAYMVGYNLISSFTLTADGTAFEPGSEQPILEVPKVKVNGVPDWCPGSEVTCATGADPGHVGGASLVFDSNGDLYLGVGDDVAPNEAHPPGNSVPLDYRAAEHRDARKTSANTNDLRGKIVRIHPLDEIAPGAEPGVGETYSIPAGNMFTPGTANTRPEIYSMGFRQPFTVHTDPANPGTIGVGEYCHDSGSDVAERSPAGICEWNLISEPAFHGWPFCIGTNSAAHSSYRWNYADNTPTGEQYDCSQANIPSDLDYAPAGQTNPGPTNAGLANVPGPAEPATIWKKVGGPNSQDPLDFGDLSAGGNQPITGPIYRHDPDDPQGAFPAYYDGSWLINNRGSNSGFWKEVRLRSDNNEMLRVHDWLPYNAAGDTNADLNSLVIGTRFGPDGALYMGRFAVGCCRNGINASQQTQIVKVEYNQVDECLADEQAPNVSHEVEGLNPPGEPDTFVNGADLTIDAEDVGCAGIDTVEYRVNSDAEEDWQPYDGPVTFDEEGEYAVDYRATDEFGNVSEVGSATFSVVLIEDADPPVASAEVGGSQDQRGFYVGGATLNLDADDGELGSGVDTIEYRVNSDDAGDWEEYSGPVPFDEPGVYDVDYRATDVVQNTSEPETISFRVINGEGCVAELGGDEFDGTEIGSQWLRHTRNGGTPTEGDMAPFLESGQLVMRTNDFELDAASATTALGPVNFLGIDLPALGNEWEVETQLTIQHTGGWQHTGLIVWQADNNFFRSTITNNLSSAERTIYVESSKDNPTTAEGARVTAGGNVNVQVGGTPEPITIKMRYTRPADANSVQAQYQIVAPESLAMPDWANFPATSAGWNNSGGWDLNPAGGPRRDSEGSRIGIIAAGNFPGSTGNNQYNGDPAEVYVDYFRVTGDEMLCEEDAPETTASLEPADPGAGGTYEESVQVNLSAADGAEGAGVDTTEYRVISDDEPGEWETFENTEGDEPFENSFTVSRGGSHVVEFRSIDAAANEEEIKTIDFSIDHGGCVPLRSDDFEAGELDLGKWSVVREDPTRLSVTDGALEIMAAKQDIHGGDTGMPNIVTQPLPPTDAPWSVTAELTWNPTTNYQNAGLLIYGDDMNFLKTGMVWSGGRRFEAFKETNNSADGLGATDVLPGDFPGTFFVRFTSSDGNAVQAQYSADGETWTDTGEATDLTGIANPQVALYATASTQAAAAEIPARFESVVIEPDEDVCQPGCGLSDEFEAGALDPKWDVRVEDGETTIEDGQLVLPILDEIDGTRPGPLALVSQQVPEGDWSLTTRVTPDLESSWAQAGLMLWQSDGNFVKFEFGRNDGGTQHRVEMAADDPVDQRETAAGAVTVDMAIETMWLRLYREGNTLAGEYAPDDGGEPGTWVEHPKTLAVSGVQPVNGRTIDPPREGEGVQLGLYAGSDINPAPYDQQARFDFARFEPDECEDDTTPPVTTVQLNGTAPEPSYDGPVTATFTATDEEGGSGVESTEYRVDGGDWTPYNPLSPPMFTDPGEYALDYRSTDVAGNVEEPPGTVSFEITGDGDTTPPVTTSSLDPADPGPGGTYDGPVDVNLSATDPGDGEPEPETHLVTATGFVWDTTEVEATVGDTVEWDFAGGAHDVCIDVVPPEGATGFGDCTGDELLGSYEDGDDGGSKTFDTPGSYLYYCSFHETGMRGTVNVAEGGGGTPGSGVEITEYRVNTDGATGEWVESENTGAADPFETDFTVSDEGSHVVEYRSTDVAGNIEEIGSVGFSIEHGDEDTTAPETTASLDPANPGPGGTYEEPVDTTLSATDPGAIASGVELTEYRVNTDGVDGEWQTSENTGGDDPFETTFTVSDEGSHVVEYRSTDVAGNLEDAGTVAFSIADDVDPPGEPELATRVQPRREKVKLGRQAKFEFTVRNRGDAAAEDVELCVKAPKRKVKVFKAACRETPTLGKGAAVEATFRLKPKGRAQGDRIRLRFVATADNADRASETATLKVEKKKKGKRGR